MAIQFDNDGSPTNQARIPQNLLDPRQRVVHAYYESHREYEKEEFKFVIKAIESIVGTVQCSARYHTGSPMLPDGQADLSWGRHHDADGNALANVQDWVCRLICFGGQWPEAQPFVLPQDTRFPAFTRRVAFPVRLYNRSSGLPILVRGGQDGNNLAIAHNTAFAPYFCEDKWNSSSEFAEFLKRWLEPSALAQAVTAAQPPNGTA
jgi:hypothetical protein